MDHSQENLGILNSREVPGKILQFVHFDFFGQNIDNTVISSKIMAYIGRKGAFMWGLLLEQPPGASIHPKYPGANRVKYYFHHKNLERQALSTMYKHVIQILSFSSTVNKKIYK